MKPIITYITFQMLECQFPWCSPLFWKQSITRFRSSVNTSCICISLMAIRNYYPSAEFIRSEALASLQALSDKSWLITEHIWKLFNSVRMDPIDKPIIRPYMRISSFNIDWEKGVNGDVFKQNWWSDKVDLLLKLILKILFVLRTFQPNMIKRLRVPEQIHLYIYEIHAKALSALLNIVVRCN